MVILLHCRGCCLNWRLLFNTLVTAARWHRGVGVVLSSAATRSQSVCIVLYWVPSSGGARARARIGRCALPFKCTGAFHSQWALQFRPCVIDVPRQRPLQCLPLCLGVGLFVVKEKPMAASTRTMMPPHAPQPGDDD